MIVFFYDNNQIVCILLLWMLLGGIGVPMATVSAQDVSTDSTGRAVKLNQVVISKRDMRMIVLRPTGDTLAVFRMRAKLWSQTARMGLPNPRRTVCHSICGRPLGLAERYGKDRESGRGIWSPVLPAENTRLHGHRDTRNIQA